MHDLNDLYYFVQVVRTAASRPPAGRWAYPSRD